MKIILFIFIFILNLYSNEVNKDIFLNEFNEKKEIEKLLNKKYFNENFILYFGDMNFISNFIKKNNIKDNPNGLFLINDNIENLGKNINFLSYKGTKFVVLGKINKEPIILTEDFFITQNKIFFKENNKIIYNNIEKTLKSYYFDKWKGKI